MSDGLDAWETEDSSKKKYSPFNFYTKSKDHQGHSTQIRLKIPDHMIPVLQMIIEAFPEHYKTYNDFHRDSMVHRVKFFEMHFEQFKQSAKGTMFSAMVEADTILAETEALKSLPSKIKKVCETFREVGDKASLMSYVANQRMASSAYPEPWKSKVIEVLDNFGV